MATEWAYADLAPEQLALLDEAEQSLDGDVVMVYRQSAWGTVDPERVTAGWLRPDDLEASQLELLQALEARLGGVIVAYRHETEE